MSEKRESGYVDSNQIRATRVRGQMNLSSSRGGRSPFSSFVLVKVVCLIRRILLCLWDTRVRKSMPGLRIDLSPHMHM
jgi:hypothetical protein